MGSENNRSVPPEIGALVRANIPQSLHDSEINFSIACFYDGQWTVKLGDEMNGYDTETNLREP